ncbi:MAG: hypothetical protein NT049_11330, partial [Planctomycetota bacterium]|nr:hypothetical protein [Planctomycetota bacterium]
MTRRNFPLMFATLILTLSACVVPAAEDAALKLNLRSQALAQDSGGHSLWQATTTPQTWKAAETALIVCDVWDKHWCRGANERLAAMLPRMNQTVKAAR